MSQIAFQAYAWDGLEEEALQNLVIELFHKANDENEEYFYLWNENNLEYEIRLVEDEEALLEKREVASDELLVGEDQVMVEKWVGGQEEEGSPSVRTFVAMALMARLGVIEELVANTHLCEVSRLQYNHPQQLLPVWFVYCGNVLCFVQQKVIPHNCH